MGRHTRRFAIWTAGLCAAGLAVTAGINSLPGGGSAGSGVPSPAPEPSLTAYDTGCEPESECGGWSELERRGDDCGTSDAGGGRVCLYAEASATE
ncbi:hypothetical protein [Streptomyces synnematoformans]|uniref:Uncharacterized protein n=1 Tax=Streptomyces synnematoformans TaxID=415721 RepID=A0ABP5K3L4_9ACTN